MRYLSGMPVDVEYGKADLNNIYRGAMSEQFVGQEMVLSQKQNVYYWSRRAKSSSSEVDYVAVIDGGIHPVEVKSGASGSLKSLHLFLQNISRLFRSNRLFHTSLLRNCLKRKSLLYHYILHFPLPAESVRDPGRTL